MNTPIDIIRENVARYESLTEEYPALHKAATPLREPSAPILGRDLSELRRNLRNPEKANVILLGDPGSGKTAMVQGFAFSEESTPYLVLAVDIERLVNDESTSKDTEIANGLLDLVEDTKRYSQENDVIVVLFIDEFHRLAMVSKAGVEALKPILEKSALNGFRIIAATTFEEYDQWIANNRALDQRLLRMNLPELPRKAVISILKSRASQYGVLELADEAVFGEIYDTSKQILISNSQPRASLDIMLSMIGNMVKSEYMQHGELHRIYCTPQELGINSKYTMSRPLLNKVIQNAYSIDIDNNVAIKDVAHALRSRILNQNQAIRTIIGGLEAVMAGFTDPTRPRLSFITPGPTGSGKTEMAKVISEAMDIPLKRFDMSRYPRPDDAVEFANGLAQAAWAAPDAYIIIDEVEKSTRECMNILLQVLDDARLTAANNPNRVISFSGNIIQLTTNLGSDVYQHVKRYGDVNADMDIELIYKSLTKSKVFESAVLGRLDMVVPFAPLPDKAVSAIATRELRYNLDIVETDKLNVYVSKDVIPHIVIDRTSKDAERGGARDAKRNVKTLALSCLAAYIANEGEPRRLILALDGPPRFKNRSIGDPKSAHIVVIQCHTVDAIGGWLKAFGDRLGVTLEDEGLYIPTTQTGKEFIASLLPLIKQGYRKFKTSERDVKKDGYIVSQQIVVGVK